MEKTAKKRGLKIALLLLVLALVAASITAIIIFNREEKLTDLKNDMLSELDAREGEYDEHTIVLYDTSRSEAKSIAEKLGAKLRITSDGSFATLTLSEGMTIRDVYSSDEYKKYLPSFAADYQAKISELEEKLPTASTVGTAAEVGSYLDYLNLSGVWNKTKGSGITVAVIDTGIDTDHPEFAGRISEYSYNATLDKIVKDYTLEDGSYDWSLIEDEQGHGTKVAGALCAAYDDSGMVGVAPAVTVIVIKAECDETGTFARTSDLVFGLYYAIERDVSVVNMSFGTYGNNPFEEAAELAYDSDVICVAAAGNDSTAALTYPAADENVIGVGALKESSWEMADYSNYGDNVDVCAPGVIYTTAVGGGYAVERGTSMSAPLVSGAFALLAATDKYITYDKAYEILIASSYDLGELGRDWTHGYGAIDVYGLVSEERGTITYDMMTDELEDAEGLFVVNRTLQEMLEPERLYAVFDGWYYDPHYVEEFNYYEDRLISDITLYAKWAAEEDGIPFEYRELDDGTIEITSYKGRRRYIAVPEYVDGKLVTSIGDGAFSGKQHLREVELSFGITRIGKDAFKDCRNLTGIIIPEAVVSIGDGAFYNCVRLSEIAFSGSSALTTVGREAFAYCSSLKRIELPEKVSSIDGSAFVGTLSLSQINVNRFNQSFTSIDGVLFNVTQTTLIAFPAGLAVNYSLPESVLYVGDYAFAFYRGSEVLLNNAVSIGKCAFVSSSLKALSVPDSVTAIGMAAFAQNANLTSVTLGSGISTIEEELFYLCTSLGEITIPEKVREIKTSAFEFSGLTSVTFAETSSIYYIGASAFAQTPLLKIDLPASLRFIYERAFSRCYLLSEVTFAEGANILAIGAYAFMDTASLTSLTLPEGLEELGDYAFMGSAITGNVTLPASLTYLGRGAFASCTNLETITVSEENASYNSIDGVVYTEDGKSLVAYPAGSPNTSYSLLSGTEKISPAAIYGTVNLVTLTLNDGLTELGESAITRNKAIKKLAIPDSVTLISRLALAYNPAMTSITFGAESSLDRLGFGALAYTSVTSLTIPKNISTIGQGAFAGSSKLTGITFAEGSKLESVSAYMFDGCTALKTVTFAAGSALTSIQAHGFEGMYNLTSVNFGDAKITNIDNFAFRFCEKLTTVTLPETVKSIGRYAFYACYSLTGITLPEAVEHIGSFAFLASEELEIYFKSEILPTYLDEDWDHGIKGYYLGVSSVETEGNITYAVLSDGNVAILGYEDIAGIDYEDLNDYSYLGNITVIGSGAFAYSALTEIVLPETLVTIQKEAFYHSNITYVEIPASVEFIGNNSFGDTPLEFVFFADAPALKVIEQSAFENTKSLTEPVIIPASVTTLGRAVFRGSAVPSVEFEEGTMVTEIPEEFFAESAIESFAAPESVTKIGDGAFNGAASLLTFEFTNTEDELWLGTNAFYQSGLEAFTIPRNLTVIEEFALVSLANLESFDAEDGNPYYTVYDGVLYSKDMSKIVTLPAGMTGTFTLPETVEKIGYGAFENTALDSVVFPENINLLSIGNRAFFGARNLTEIRVPESVIAIDYYAFAYAKALSKVTFAEGSALKGVYEGAFYGCSALSDITLPDSVIEISDFAFYGCSALTELPLSENTTIKGIYPYAFAYSGISGELTLPATLTDIGDYAFLSIDAEKITVPSANSADLIIGLGAFGETTNLTEITLPFIGASYDDAEITWFGYIFGAGNYTANATYVPTSLKKVSFNTEFTAVPAYAFYELDAIEEINLPDSINSVYHYAFYKTVAKCELKNEIQLLNVDGTVKTSTSGSVNCGNYDLGKGIFGTLKLAKGLTSIGSQAFRNCSSLTSINIPEGVTSIGSSAFNGCSSLTSIDIPDGVTYIGGWAFYNCSSLTSIEIPGGVTTIGDYAFQNCTSLTSIDIPDRVTSIGNSAFYNCSSLASIEIPEGVISLGSGAFQDCTSLTSIDIPDGVTSIGNYAFYSCSSLTSIDIPDGVTSIGSSAFSDCTSLTSIDISDSVTSIGSSAFSGCSSLVSIDIPDGVTSIGSMAFSGCSSLYKVENKSELPITLSNYAEYGNITSYAKLLIDKVGNKYYKDGITEFEYIDTADGFRFSKENDVYKLIGYFGSEDTVTLPSDINGSSYEIYRMRGVKNVIIPSGVTTIGSDAFYGCSSLMSIEIPDGVTSIGWYAFRDCSSLTSIDIPESVTSIGSHAFYRCSSLTSIDIPDGVTSLGYNAFRNCSSLTSINIPDGVTSIGDFAFYNCRSLTSIDLPESLTSIGDSAFYSCSSLTSIDLPDSLTSIDDSAFSNSGITVVRIPKNVKTIGSAAFSGCNIKEFTIDEENASFTLIDGVVYNKGATKIVYIMDNITEITIPSTVTYISSAFKDNLTIEKVTFEASSALTSIGDSAFEGCSSLTSIEIPDSVTSIGYEAFHGCSSLASINIPEGVTTIGSYAFSGCSSLASIEIPEGVTSLGSGAFQNCNSLTSIDIPDGVTSIGSMAFYGCSSLTSIDIPEGVTSIGDSAFSGCSSLASIEIPEGVTSLGSGAFQNCNSLTSIDIPDGVTSIGNYAFYGCSSLTSIDIPEGVTSIGHEVFHGCSSLASINIPEGVTSIGSLAFEGCSSLTSIDIPDGVISIGDSAFSGCSSLVSIDIPDGVTSIGNYAFHYCSSLASINISERVTSIGICAFYNCRSLMSIDLPESLTSIGDSAFEGCSSLYKIENKSELPITFDNYAEYGDITRDAKILIDKDGNKIYRDTESVTHIETEDGFLFEESGGSYKLVAYSGSEETVTLPLDINGNSYEIYKMRGVKNVIIPSGVTSIGDWAFYDCSSLTSIEIPEGVTTIGDYAFEYCTSLTSIDIPEGVTSIRSYAFSGCSSLESVRIPQSVTSIYSYAFSWCSSLKHITIPYGVTYIGSSAFKNCRSLASIVIADSVTSIGTDAFSTTEYYNDASNWTDGALYISNHLIEAPSDAKYFEVPEGTISIASDAFENCKYTLKHLTIGGNHSSALSGFTNLETLVLTELPTSHYIYGYFGSTSSIPSTLTKVVIADTARLSPASTLTKNPFSYMTGITVYVEKTEKELRWDDNFADWNNGNTVVYGDEWINAIFYDNNGKVISSEIFSTSAVIRIPYLEIEGNAQYSYVVDGYDLDGDGIADTIPATSSTDIIATAVVRSVVNNYTVTVYDKDGETVIYEASLPYGSEIILPEPEEKRGYVFLGFIGYEDGMTVTSDVTFNTSWKHEGEGHEYSEPVWVDATCTENGGNKHECTVCGEWYLTEVVEATGHNYVVTVIAPTCTEEGYDLYSCTCGDEYRENLVSALGHTFDILRESVAPTCTEDGYKLYACACGEVDTVTVNATGHDEIYTKVESTCTERGYIKTNCYNCTYESVEELELGAHNFVRNKNSNSNSWFKAQQKKYHYYIRYEIDPDKKDKSFYFKCTDCGAIELTGERVGTSTASVMGVCEHGETEWGTILPSTFFEEGIEVLECKGCGSILSARGIDVKELSSDFKIASAALNLTEDINLVYTVGVPEGYESPYMVFLFNGVEYTVTDYTVRADGMYSFRFAGINPQCMGDNVCATLYATCEGELVSRCVAEYSVLQYCKLLLSHPAYNTNEKLVTLISDLLVYGANTQLYRKYKTDALVTEGLNLTPSVYENTSENKIAITGTAAEGLAWRSAGLYLTNAMAVYITFTAEDVEDLKINLTINSRTTTFDVSELTPDANGRYTVYLYNVMAHEFDSEIVASFVRGGEEVGQKLTYTVNSYILSAEGYVTDTTLKALIESIYNYGASVEAYRN